MVGSRPVGLEGVSPECVSVFRELLGCIAAFVGRERGGGRGVLEREYP